jgi:hypothetical protein
LVPQSKVAKYSKLSSITAIFNNILLRSVTEVCPKTEGAASTGKINVLEQPSKTPSTGEGLKYCLTEATNLPQ